jgi:flagellar protein FliS
MSYSSNRSRRGQLAQTYESVGLETQVMSASPTQLITLLFDGALSAIARARLHLQHGNIAERGMAISKAIDIVDSGLKASVDMEAGGEVAKYLVASYELIIQNLMLANLNADEEKLTVAETMLKNLGSAWREACDAPRESTPLQVHS